MRLLLRDAEWIATHARRRQWRLFTINTFDTAMRLADRIHNDARRIVARVTKAAQYLADAYCGAVESPTRPTHKVAMATDVTRGRGTHRVGRLSVHESTKPDQIPHGPIPYGSSEASGRRCTAESGRASSSNVSPSDAGVWIGDNKQQVVPALPGGHAHETSSQRNFNTRFPCRCCFR